MINWGEEYFDHYTTFFKNAVDRKVFQGLEGGSSIQVLIYDGVLKGCKVFASLGLTHYEFDVQDVAEVVLVTDDGFDDCPAILANTLFYMINDQLKMTRGASVKGIKYINEDFYSRYSKDALYFTTPFGFPAEFSEVDSGYVKGKVYMAFLISDDEAGYLKQFGFEKFEDLLEKQDVDVFDIDRDSII